MTATLADPPDLAEAPPACSPAKAGAQGAMTPGRYMTLRREAARLTIQHVVVMLVPPARAGAADDRAELRNRIRLLEEDALHRPAVPDLIDRLGTIFSFDTGIYWLLVCRLDSPATTRRLPKICRGCGCAWNDACDDHGQGCAWVAGDPTLCTVCDREGRGGEKSDAA